MQRRDEPGGGTGGRVRGSSRHHVRVDDRVAKVHAEEDFPAFSVVEVREACEFEPVRMAIGILGWASEKPDPPKALLGWARKRGRGYYRSHRRRPNGTEEHGRCLQHLERKEVEAVEKRRSGLTQREVQDLTRLWYALGHRAAMRRIPDAAWDQIHGKARTRRAPREATLERRGACFGGQSTPRAAERRRRRGRRTEGVWRR